MHEQVIDAVSTPTEQTLLAVTHPSCSISKGLFTAYSPATWPSISYDPTRLAFYFDVPQCPWTSGRFTPFSSAPWTELDLEHFLPLHSMPNSTGSRRCINKQRSIFFLTDNLKIRGLQGHFLILFLFTHQNTAAVSFIAADVTCLTACDHEPGGLLEVPDEISTVKAQPRMCVRAQMKYENLSWELGWGWEARRGPGLSVHCHVESHILQQKENLDHW